jgi:serine/threonine protein kinase
VGGHAAAKEGERKGDFLGGKYLLEDCLGIGGMGEVYRAQNVSLGRKVAIKLLNKEHTGNEDDVMRFLREARAAAAIRHPNVVDVFDVARDDDGTPFIVQELLSGQDLEQYLGASDGRLPASEALEIMIPVADAIAAAHKQNVVHRDLKPANIFLAREGDKIIPKVLDFGACLYQTVGALSAKEQRMLIGTPHYMAPEQITTAMDVDRRADVWAMGVILYELLVGETPFEAADANSVLKLVRTRSVQRLRKMAPAAPESLEEIVTCCLDRDRKKRFADASVVREELEKVRRELRGKRRQRVDTEPELASAAKLEPKIPESKRLGAVVLAKKKQESSPAIDERVASRNDPRSDESVSEPSSQRIPSLVLKAGKSATKRRGSSLLTLSSPDDAVSWGDADPPQSVSRPIEAAKPRTAADVIRDAERAGGSLDLPDADVPPPSKRAAPPRRDAGPPTLGLSPPAERSADPAPASRSPEAGAPRDIDLEETDDPALDLDLDLDLEPPNSRRATASGQSSIPPVLDPRVANRSSRSDRPEPMRADGPSSQRSPESSNKDKLRTSGTTPRESALTPPLTPMRTARTPTVAVSSDASPPWPPKAKLAFAAAIIAPAVVAFFVLRFAPMVLAPIGHAMRGDSPLASGVLAVITLVAAAALAARSLGSSRSTGMAIATVGAVLLGIVMIIVTFSASETAELGIPPPAGGIVPFIAPIIPLGLGLASLRRASSAWLSRYERGEAIRFVVITSFMLFAMLELGPLGAVRAATSNAASAPAPSAVAPAAPAAPARSAP